MFKPSKLRTYLLLAQDAGLCPEQILEGSGTSWDDVEALKPLELDTIVELFDYLARNTPLGFAVASANTSKVRNYGIVGFATMSMPTLREALQHWSRYCLVAGDPLITTISEEGDLWHMHIKARVTMSPAAERYCLEAAMAAIEPVIEELTEAPANTVRIEFSWRRPADDTGYGVLRTRDLRFGHADTIYHGQRADLDRLIPARDSAVREMFLRQCDEFLNELTHSRSLRERLNDLMRASGGDIPSLDAMAVALGVSRRSLQRALREADITYQQLVREFRIRHAMMLLRERHTNVKTIAHLLGFKTTDSFRRVFREWTGQSIRSWQGARNDLRQRNVFDDQSARGFE